MQYRRIWCVVFFFVFSVFASLSRAELDFEPKMYRSADGRVLHYRIHLPEPMDGESRYPLLLFFHGAGERGDDNASQLVNGVPELLAFSRKNHPPLLIVEPQCPADEQWVDTPWGAEAHTMPEKPSAAMARVMDLLNELPETYPVDPARIYVTGLSMGGFGTWDILQRDAWTQAYGNEDVLRWLLSQKKGE